MLESGKYLELINERIAALRTEIAQSGTLGLTNINKHSENFVRRLLNLVYGYKLKNLNQASTTYPGLDLGDETAGIGVQVTSEKSSDKVEDTLTKVIRYKHYNTFGKIKILMLLGKQGSYTIGIDTSSFFNFDWKKDVIDISDVLKDIQHLNVEKMKTIYEFLESELPQTIFTLRNETDSQPIGTNHLINILQGLEKSGLTYYEHFRCTIHLQGHAFSVPQIYKDLLAYNNTQHKKLILFIFNNIYQKSITSKQALFRKDIAHAGASNHFKETVLEILPNKINFEFAQYKSDESLLTNLMEEFYPIYLLLFFCNAIYKEKELHVNLDVDISTNGNLIFYPNSSLFSVKAGMNTYSLNPRQYSFSQSLNDIGNESLTILLEQMIHGFAASEIHFGETPFLSINKDEQLLVFNHTRPHLQM